MLRNPNIQRRVMLLQRRLEKRNAYMKFVNELANHDIQLEWRYYTDGKAWLAKGLYKWTGVRGGQNETIVFWISIWENFFKVTLYVPEKSRPDVFSFHLMIKLSLVFCQDLGQVNSRYNPFFLA